MGVTKYLFDSGILSAYIDRRQGVHELARMKTAEAHRIGTCLRVLAEMAAGIERSSRGDREGHRQAELIAGRVLAVEGVLRNCYNELSVNSIGRLPAGGWGILVRTTHDALFTASVGEGSEDARDNAH